jgi:hypothetical protein
VTATGPVSGRPLDLAIVTGDMTDSAQANELHWLAAILDGGPVHPDSGDLGRFEGVGSLDRHDPAVRHPDGGPGDVARDRTAFPLAPGCSMPPVDRSPQQAWACPGSRCTAIMTGWSRERRQYPEGTTMHATGTSKAWRPGPGAQAQPARDLLDGIIDERTMDLLAKAEVRAGHRGCATAAPGSQRACRLATWRTAAMGFTQRTADQGTAYYRHDLG